MTWLGEALLPMFAARLMDCCIGRLPDRGTDHFTAYTPLSSRPPDLPIIVQPAACGLLRFSLQQPMLQA